VGAAIGSALQRLLLATLARLVGADPAQVASLASSSFQFGSAARRVNTSG
jgi:hypothetical protein